MFMKTFCGVIMACSTTRYGMLLSQATCKSHLKRTLIRLFSRLMWNVHSFVFSVVLCFTKYAWIVERCKKSVMLRRQDMVGSRVKSQSVFWYALHDLGLFFCALQFTSKIYGCMCMMGHQGSYSKNLAASIITIFWTKGACTADISSQGGVCNRD